MFRQLAMHEMRSASPVAIYQRCVSPLNIPVAFVLHADNKSIELISLLMS